MAFRKFFNASSFLHPFSFQTSFIPYLYKTPRLRSIITVTHKMRAIYFQHDESEDKFSGKLCFQREDLNFNKEINFERKISESVEVFLEKLKNKINAAIEKKRKHIKKKKGEEIPPLPPVNCMFLLDDQPLAPDIILQDLFTQKLNGQLKLRVYDSDYEVIVNAPVVKDIALPLKIRAGCIIYPRKLEFACVDESKCSFTWYKRSKSKDWTQCGEGFFYIPQKEDVEFKIKLACLPVNKFYVGPVSEVISDEVVTEFEGLVEINKRLEYTKTKTNDDEIRIVSYNILADTYTHTKEAKTVLFTYCNPDFMALNYRLDLINAELQGYKADLICLQEVDKRVFEKDLYPVFVCNKYNGVYHEKEGSKEGCAFFYDTNKFKLLHTSQHFLTNEILNNPILIDIKEKIVNNQMLLERLQLLSTQIQIGVLECLKKPDDLIVFGNVHLYFHPNADHIRLLQGLSAFKILQNTVEYFKTKVKDKNMSIILCGDFNSTPDCGFYKFLTEGYVDSSEVDWKSKDGEEIENLSCSQPMKFKSACGTPKYTNYTNLFKSCLDYIYFQTDRLEVKQIVPIPDEETLQKQIAIPSEFFPSDHIALIADLKFKT